MNINDLFPSKYLRAADVANPRVVTICNVTREEIGDDKQNKPVLYFFEDSRGMVLNKTNGQIIAHTLGEETEHWLQKKIELRSEPVSFQGRIVDSIRVRVVDVPQVPIAQQAVPPVPVVPPVVQPPSDDDIDV